MKRIKAKDLPEALSEEIISTLVEMALEFPKKTFDWAKVSEVLETRGQLHIILNRVEELQKELEKARKDAMTEEERKAEAAAWERIRNDPDPYKFYGNMGQPETPQEFKNRYGIWPPGYDKNGNKLP
ncbi:MAG: hypothetical protein KIPDCIKN_03515 [Haliscomenobacter sp.]|jgi:uncharacterized protein YozE (UPF0346 family)|nr:hypothetical protein [Haliscomenobacter sp.]